MAIKTRSKLLCPVMEELDYIYEIRNFAAPTEVAIKQDMTTQYNRRVRPRDFDPGHLVLRRVDVGNKNAREGKLAANWERLYRVTAITETDAPRITMRPPNTKNMEHKHT